ncbi:LuxR C-terminal-related transcriptional regulator, partial [Klebsiella pneumoniae]|nr:LuxR C-terminal-related transcriptional regulator [Klebsiella pneumoniae]MDZ1921977.1 LuxR C-terminal-related transcriptional regulator [Klebsiella pneumoniae]
SAEFTIGEGELMAHDVPLGCAPDEYDDLISGTCSHLPKEWFDDLRLSLSEQLMLRLLMAGMTMEEVAVNLNTSLKSLYRKRTALYERLGLDNFNEACLFIFRNKLLEQTERSL